MFKKFEMELAGRTLRVDVDRVAKQANGAVLMHYGDTTVLCTATASEKPREGIDFFPLSVEYNERLYSVGKIPGGFNKREGKASENAILTCRVIDRPMRPLFPKDYRNDVTLENLVMSVDQDCSPELTAMLGAAIATSISDIPFDGPISTTPVSYTHLDVYKRQGESVRIYDSQGQFVGIFRCRMKGQQNGVDVRERRRMEFRVEKMFLTQE